MEKSTTIIDAQTSLLRELRETYVVLFEHPSDESAVATVAILQSIEKLALAAALLVARRLASQETELPAAEIATQRIKPPAAEFCKVTHDVVRIRNERNGQPGWEDHAAAFCGISPEMAIKLWDAAVTKTSSNASDPDA